MGKMCDLFLSIDCFFENHDQKNKIEKHKHSTVHYKQCKNCDERQIMMIEEVGSEKFNLNKHTYQYQRILYNGTN